MPQQRPVHEIRLGTVRAAIWENHGDANASWFNVVVSRLYKLGNAWKDTTALRRDDLPVAAKALELAYAWILDRQSTSTRGVNE